MHPTGEPWNVTEIARFIGAERGTVRRWAIRGRLPGWVQNGPRKSRVFADSPALRFALDELRRHHGRPDSKWREPAQSARRRIERLGEIASGEVPTSPEDRQAAAQILRAVLLRWHVRDGTPGVCGALEFARHCLARGREQDERVPAALVGLIESLENQTLIPPSAD